jgi:hypothetical protein
MRIAAWRWVAKLKPRALRKGIAQRSAVATSRRRNLLPEWLFPGPVRSCLRIGLRVARAVAPDEFAGFARLGGQLLKVVAILLCLVGVILLAALVDYDAVCPPAPIESPWRLTSAGWERADAWPPPTSLSARSRGQAGIPNPLLLALFESLAAGFCLLAFPPVNARIHTNPKR